MDKNVPLPDRFGWADASRLAQSGFAVAREGWNGKGMWITWTPGSTLDESLPVEKLSGACLGVRLLEPRRPITIEGHFDMCAADGNIEVGWRPTTRDLRGQDWMVVGNVGYPWPEQSDSWVRSLKEGDKVDYFDESRWVSGVVGHNGVEHGTLRIDASGGLRAYLTHIEARTALRPAQAQTAEADTEEGRDCAEGARLQVGEEVVYSLHRPALSLAGLPNPELPGVRVWRDAEVVAVEGDSATLRVELHPADMPHFGAEVGGEEVHILVAVDLDGEGVFWERADPEPDPLASDEKNDYSEAAEKVRTSDAYGWIRRPVEAPNLAFLRGAPAFYRWTWNGEEKLLSAKVIKVRPGLLEVAVAVEGEAIGGARYDHEGRVCVSRFMAPEQTKDLLVAVESLGIDPAVSYWQAADNPRPVEGVEWHSVNGGRSWFRGPLPKLGQRRLKEGDTVAYFTTRTEDMGTGVGRHLLCRRKATVVVIPESGSVVTLDVWLYGGDQGVPADQEAGQTRTYRLQAPYGTHAGHWIFGDETTDDRTEQE